MSFIDYSFLPMLMGIVLVYFLLPMRYRWIALLLVSIFFFCTWGIELIPYVLVATWIAWFTAKHIENKYILLENTLDKNDALDKKEKNSIKMECKKKCKYILWVAIALILGVLVYTKTQKYLVDIPILSGIVEFNTWLYREITKVFFDIPILNNFVQYTNVYKDREIYAFFVPLGISYYTMSLISYLADVYWKKDTAEKKYFKLLLFVLYFPKILQGPISKHRHIKKTLYEGHEFCYQRFCFGLQRMLWGYFKKLVIADRLLLFVSPVFERYEMIGGGILFMGALLGAFQMYCDFSGCMDMALGMSEIFGIELEENFKRPFLAKSASEFWNRWHISLGAWFTDYIYMPIVISPRIINISGKIKKRFGKRAAKSFVAIVPIATVWLITGLWHGTGWNYILWGGYWGVLMIISNVFAPEIKKTASFLHIDLDSVWFQKFRQCRTFILFVISRILTIPSDVSVSAVVYKKLFTDIRPWELLDGTIFTFGLNQANFIVGVIAMVILLYVMKMQEQGMVIREEIAKLPLVLRWMIYYIGIFSVLIFGIYGGNYNASAFIYMNF